MRKRFLQGYLEGNKTSNITYYYYNIWKTQIVFYFLTIKYELHFTRQSAVKIELLNLKKQLNIISRYNIVKSVSLCFPFVVATPRVVNVSVRKGVTECTAALPRKMSATQLLYTF